MKVVDNLLYDFFLGGSELEREHLEHSLEGVSLLGLGDGFGLGLVVLLVHE